MPGSTEVDVVAEIRRLLREVAPQVLGIIVRRYRDFAACEDAGLVIDRRDGTRRLYQLDPTGIEAVRSYFDTFWQHALAAFKTAVEKEDR